MQLFFGKAAEFVSRMSGTSWAFMAALFSILTWAVLGPAFGFSDTWQLVINTATTIVTFLMVFLIQNTQNRDNAALHAKLDELILITQGADNELIAAESLSEEEIAKMRAHIEGQKKHAGVNGTPSLNVMGSDGSAGKLPAKRRAKIQRAR